MGAPDYRVEWSWISSSRAAHARLWTNGACGCSVVEKLITRQDKPKDAELYSTKNLCADLAAFLDALGLSEPLVVIGHDWGAAVAWRFLLWHPERIKLLIKSVLSRKST